MVRESLVALKRLVDDAAGLVTAELRLQLAAGDMAMGPAGDDAAAATADLNQRLQVLRTVSWELSGT